jgi:hypothetical protein
MPEVRYVGGATYALRDGPTWADGDVYEVGAETAARLCDDWRFERVEREDEETGEEPASPASLIESGECPWCSDYSGDAVGRHASAAHPDEWAGYKEER